MKRNTENGTLMLKDVQLFSQAFTTLIALCSHYTLKPLNVHKFHHQSFLNLQALSNSILSNMKARVVDPKKNSFTIFPNIPRQSKLLASIKIRGEWDESETSETSDCEWQLLVEWTLSTEIKYFLLNSSEISTKVSSGWKFAFNMRRKCHN